MKIKRTVLTAKPGKQRKGQKQLMKWTVIFQATTFTTNKLLLRILKSQQFCHLFFVYFDVICLLKTTKGNNATTKKGNKINR